MRIIIFCIAVFWTSELISQNKQLIYGVKEIPQSLLVNPGGIVEQQYHFGIPFLSQFHDSAFNIGSDGSISRGGREVSGIPTNTIPLLPVRVVTISSIVSSARLDP